MQSFRDPEIRKKLSVEAVGTAGAHAYRMGLAQRKMSFSRRWDLVEVYMTLHSAPSRLVARNIAQIAREQGKGIRILLNIALDDSCGTSFQVIDRNNDRRRSDKSSAPYTVIGTTDGARGRTRGTARTTAPAC